MQVNSKKRILEKNILCLLFDPVGVNPHPYQNADLSQQRIA
jgi:hypothetical protein